MGLVATYFLRISPWTPSRTPWKCPLWTIDATTKAISFCFLVAKLNNIEIGKCTLTWIFSGQQGKVGCVLIYLRPFHFLFGLVVWYLPLAGCALFTWLCQGMRMFPMHQSWQQRCWSPTLVEYAQLLDMFKTGGHGVSRAFPIHHTTGIPSGDLWWSRRVPSHPHHC